MKTSFLARLLALALLTTAPAFASADHGPAHGHAAKQTGPNKGRVLTELKPHAELFVTADRKVRLTFIDERGKPVAIPAGLTATLITGERAAPTTLAFASDGGEGAAGTSLLSTAALPAGQTMPAILRVKPAAEAALVTIRFQLNLAQCGECEQAEYACACGH
jgi:hypothetical protein